MKAYNEYMDHIEVTDALHRRLLSAERPARRRAGLRSGALAAAGLTVVLLGALTLPGLLRGEVPTVPTGTVTTTSGGTAATSGLSDQYALTLNKAEERPSADKILIRGHFWQELTPDQLRAVFPGLIEVQEVFPGLVETWAVTATAHFSGDGTLHHIDAQASPTSGAESGRTAHIQVAPGEVTPDYTFEGEPVTSDILGVPVTAGVHEDEKGTVYFASFTLSGVGYYVEMTGGKAEKQLLPAFLDQLIGGGAAELGVLDDPVIPELREDALGLDEARADPDFGAYLPRELPSGFAFESALRFVNQERNNLSALWAKGMGHIQWRVSVLTPEDGARITSVSDTGNYDLSLYPIPRADSVPDELREIVDNPVFRIGELTLEAVKARAYTVDDQGDEPGFRMRFGVLYGDILVEVNVKGAPPEAVFGLLRELPKQG